MVKDMSIEVKITVADFTVYPAFRYEKQGPESGERFRNDVLIPAFKQSDGNIMIDLNGTEGYSASFLEEAFGGLVRKLGPSVISRINFISDEDPSIAETAKEYMLEATEH